MKLNTYLGFDGQCAEAFRFYEQALGGELVMMMTYDEMPASGPARPELAGRIMHARLVIGDQVLMGSDAPPQLHQPAHGFHVNIAVDTVAEAERVFETLATGGQVTMPIAPTFWAERFGMLVDRYGTPWMVNCEKKPAEAAGDAFETSRVLGASPERVFEAFADPAHLGRWWGPKGFKVIGQTMDFRPGGSWLYGLESPAGQQIWGKFVYREIAAPQRIVVENFFSDEAGNVTRHPAAPTWPLRLLSTFTFVPEGGKTRLLLHSAPIDPSTEERATFSAGREGMTGGWKGTLDQLEDYLAGLR